VADSTQRYALYLPPGWNGSARRPLLLVMDPRGRAVAALERFREGARRHGWLIMSSHDTRSDTDRPDVNRRAVNAMISDARTHLHADTARVYLAGHSGTARLAWIYARALSPHVAGVIGVGAGLPSGLAGRLLDGEEATPLPDHFAFWGGSGRLDFNHREVRLLDGELDRRGIRHRVVHWDGPHAWPPSTLVTEAVAWLELAAMRHGLAAVDSAYVDSLLAARAREARRATARGDTVRALEAWRALATDLEGLAPVAEARRRVAGLETSEAARRYHRIREEQAEEHRAFVPRLARQMERIRTARPPPDPGTVARELGLEQLRRRRAGTDRQDALQAGRLLELVYVRASFYLPRQALEEGEPSRALVALEVADRAAPGRVRTCLFRARAHALAGRIDAGLDALACAQRRGPLPPSLLENDPWLAPLRDRPRWRRLVGSP
jgi:hypothetical protein